MPPAPEMGQGHGTLSTAAGMVADARSDLDRLDRELVDHIDIARSAWAGRGGSAFSALGQAWAEKQRTIVGALDRFESSLRSTEKDNLGTDEVQSAAFGRHQQRLG
ncbi:MAG TPA: hypothetical protein VHW64_03025 [Nocardioides sp.]|uniref:WXG100 family type VII secretion target n=1 Tax=Nocardioides sp. TaxID=35761 RepID=UPI002E31D621|nr:hypothetical protein [Nocardioides sp.]HEX3929650.1 hypothetical protein [Nocardioides sp.]